MGIVASSVPVACYTVSMSATPDLGAASFDDTAHTLTIEDTAQLYANAGHPRTLRTIQRYCASGHLDCTKATTALGDKYFVAPQSVARHIAQIEELTPLERRATLADVPRPVATPFGPHMASDQGRPVATPPPVATPTTDASIPASSESIEAPQRDESRRDATSQNAQKQAPAPDTAMAEKYVVTIERENEFLRGQIAAKDQQITDLSARFSETQRLVAGLQRMIAPLLGQADPYRDSNQASKPSAGDHQS